MKAIINANIPNQYVQLSNILYAKFQEIRSKSVENGFFEKPSQNFFYLRVLMSNLDPWRKTYL